MFNSLNRLQNVFGFFTTVAFIVAAFIAASDMMTPRTPSASLKSTNLQVVKGRPNYYSAKKEEYAIIKFDLDADLSTLFTWNTKQVFVYVSAQWTQLSKPTAGGAGRRNETNSAVIWDSIITAPSSDHLANIGPAAMRKLKKSAAGKSIDPSRGILKLKNQRPKYQITHPSGKLANVQDVRLRLEYNVQPWVGPLTWDQTLRDYGLWKRVEGGVSEPFMLPGVKGAPKPATPAASASAL